MRMEFIAEFVVRLIGNILLSFPGAAIRWLLHRGTIPYAVLIKQDFSYNASFAGLLFVVLFVIVQVSLRMK